MRNGKYSRRRSGVSSKALILCLVMMLVIGCTVGTTLAWLTDKTDAVTNTFTVGDINIDLNETTDVYQMIPGHTIAKDPKVTVEDGSEDCWLFVKVEEHNVTDFLTYSIAEGWDQLKDAEGKEVPGVYCRRVMQTDAGKEFSVLAGDSVSVKYTVTKQMLNDLTDLTQPTLTFTAYACQYWKTNDAAFTAAEAWAIVNP